MLNDEDNKLIDKNENNHFFASANSGNLNDEEKIKIYIDQIKNLKLMNESDMIQIKTQKADIKELKEKIKKWRLSVGN